MQVEIIFIYFSFFSLFIVKHCIWRNSSTKQKARVHMGWVVTICYLPCLLHVLVTTKRVLVTKTFGQIFGPKILKLVRDNPLTPYCCKRGHIFHVNYPHVNIQIKSKYLSYAMYARDQWFLTYKLQICKIWTKISRQNHFSIRTLIFPSIVHYHQIPELKVVFR
jgi:hypothetical protein